MRIRYIIDTLTSVDIQELAKIGGKVIEIYDGVIYRENFKMSPFKKVIAKSVALKQKYENEGNDVSMGELYEQILKKFSLVNPKRG